MKTQTIVLFSILGVFFILTSCNTDVNTKGYVVAFAENNDRVRVRYSENGTTWNDSNIGDHATDLGVGIAYNGGVSSSFAWANKNNRLEFSWGLGATYGNQSTDNSSQLVNSAPVIAGIRNVWFFAYRTGSQVAIRVYKDRDFYDLDCAPVESSNNDNVVRRPAITLMGNKLLVSWMRQGNSTKLYCILGEVDATQSGCNIINWTDKYDVTIPDQINGETYGGIRNSPSLTNDGNQFYLGFIRSTAHTGNGDVLNRHEGHISESSDGISWNFSSPHFYSLGIQTEHFEIAANPFGEILIIAVHGSTNMNKAWIQNSDGTKTALNASDIFGSYVPDILKAFGVTSLEDGKPNL